MTRHSPPLVRRGNTYKTFLFLICFFGSGATSLSLEVAWSKELSYLLGVDLYASTTVVTAYMAGLGLGAILAARYCRWSKVSILSYAVLQMLIGVCGIVSIPLFRSTHPVFSLLYDTLSLNSELFLLARFMVVLVLMMIPVTMMGMTLPIVVGASFDDGKKHFETVAGLFYGINTIGAVTGTLLTGFWLVPSIGILKTCMLAGMFDLLIGISAFWFHKSVLSKSKLATTLSDNPQKRQQFELHRPPSSQPWYLSRTGLVFLLSGMVALSFEICWFRLLVQVIGPSVHAFSIMLAVYLFGIGLGSVLGAIWIRRVRQPKTAMGILLLIVGLGTLTTLFYANQLPIWYARLFLQISKKTFSVWHLLIQSISAGLLILPATLPLGALFPVVTRVYNDERASEHHRLEPSVGQLYFLNTVGAVAGCLITGFWLIPLLGVSPTLKIGSGIVLGLAAAVFLTIPTRAQFIRLAYGGLSLATGLILMASVPAFDQFVLNTGIYTEMFSQEFKEKMATQKSAVTPGHLLFIDEGINSSVAVIANKFGGGNLTLHIAGHWVATTEFHGRLHLHLLGHLPMLLAQQIERAAVIGLGTGITAGAILQYPQLKKLDIFEIEPGVVEAARFYEYINHSPLQDPRTTLYTVDGRSRLTYHPTVYDVISADPIHPLSAGSGNLYSVDFYRIIASRLRQGGIFCQWIPLGGISPMSYTTILSSIHTAFPYMALFSFFGESVILASMQPIQLPWEEHLRRYYSENVREDFESLDMLTPFNLFAFFEGGQDHLGEYLTGHTHTTTDDNVWLEHRMAFDVFDRSLKTLIFEIRKSIKKEGYESLVQMLPGIPVDRLDRELASLSKDGDRYFKKAVEAFNRKDYRKMEVFSRRAFADLNSKYFYQAGLALAYCLRRTDRLNEALAVLKRLETFHPALEEAYQAEAVIHAHQGRQELAKDAVQRGLMFNPLGPKLLKLKERMY